MALFYKVNLKKTSLEFESNTERPEGEIVPANFRVQSEAVGEHEADTAERARRDDACMSVGNLLATFAGFCLININNTASDTGVSAELRNELIVESAACSDANTCIVDVVLRAEAETELTANGNSTFAFDKTVEDAVFDNSAERALSYIAMPAEVVIVVTEIVDIERADAVIEVDAEIAFTERIVACRSCCEAEKCCQDTKK